MEIDRFREKLLSMSPTDIPSGYEKNAEQRLGRFLERTNASDIGVKGLFQMAGKSSPYEEMKKVYGSRTPQLLLERAEKFGEDDPDIPEDVRRFLPPMASSPQGVRDLGKEIPFGVSHSQYSGRGFDAITERENLRDPRIRKELGVSDDEYQSGSLPIGSDNPVIAYTEDGYRPSTIAHEQQHALTRPLTPAGDAQKVPTLRGFDGFDGGDYPENEYVEIYNEGANVVSSISEAMGHLSGAVRLFGSVHGRPPDTEEEVVEAIGLLEAQSLNDGNPLPWVKGLHDALRELDWTKKVGKYITKRSNPVEGGLKYV